MRARIVILFLTLAALHSIGENETYGQQIDTNRCNELGTKVMQYLDVFPPDTLVYQMGYDTGKAYIEQCASLSYAWKKFNPISFCNANRSEVNKQRYPEYREWLKEVLYYNADTPYYCEDVESIIGTLFWFDSVRGNDSRGKIAIDSFLMKSGRCSGFINVFHTSGTWDALYRSWMDTVKDPIATPFDSTIPTLEDLDLGILRGNPNQGGVPVVAERRIGELIAMRNPFAETLELRYTLDKSAMTRIDVFDVLGKSVHSIGQGFQTNGEHRISIDTKQWTQGTYYVRLSTPSGDVKTVKVIKE